jgi:hypothetical protein
MAFLIGASSPGLSGVAGIAGAATRAVKVPFAVGRAGFLLLRATRRGRRAGHLLHRMARSGSPVIFAVSAQTAALSPTTDKIAQSIQKISVALRDLSATGDKAPCAMPAWLASSRVDDLHLVDFMDEN